MTKDKISIIIPTFNRCDLLAEALNSITSQTSPDWEALIVDDGSTDETEKFVKSLALKEKRISYHKRERYPKGAATCRNIGLEHASYDYVIFLDSDDLMAPDCIESRLKAFRANPGCDFIVSQIATFSSSAAKPEYLWNINNDEDDIYRFIKLDSVWQTSSVTWRKDSVTILGGFDENLHCWQDVDIHLRALVAGFEYNKFFEAKPDILYRKQNQFSISQQQINSQEKLQSRIELLFKAYYIADERMDIIKELHWMAANVITSAASGHHFKSAYQLLFNKSVRHMLKIRERFDLLKLLLLHQFRLERVATGRKIRENITERLLWKNTICQVPVSQIS